MASSAVPNAAVRMVWGGGLSAESLGLDAAADKHDVSLQKQNLGELYAGKLVIGAGSFGEAIDAVHVASGTPVVLKVVKRRADRVGEDYVRRCVTHDNIFAILNRLGVALRGPSCVLGDACVPCLDNSCFPPSEFDNLWILSSGGTGEEPELTWLKY